LIPWAFEVSIFSCPDRLFYNKDQPTDWVSPADNLSF